MVRNMYVRTPYHVISLRNYPRLRLYPPAAETFFPTSTILCTLYCTYIPYNVKISLVIIIYILNIILINLLIFSILFLSSSSKSPLYPFSPPTLKLLPIYISTESHASLLGRCNCRASDWRNIDPATATSRNPIVSCPLPDPRTFQRATFRPLLTRYSKD